MAKYNSQGIDYDFDESDEAECLVAVKRDGWLITWLPAEARTEAVRMVAVQQQPYVIQSVPQTEKICLAAVKQNGMALRCVDDQTFEICCEAVKQDPEAIEFIRSDKLREKVAKIFNIKIWQ